MDGLGEGGVEETEDGKPLADDVVIPASVVRTWGDKQGVEDMEEDEKKPATDNDVEGDDERIATV